MLSARDIVAAELEGWRDSIDAGSWTQDHALYRPGTLMDLSCTLALIEAGVGEPDPFACRRIVTHVDRFTEDGGHRRCSSVDAAPRAFAEGGGLLGDWTSGRNRVGALAPEEWKEHGIAVVWWRPHSEGLRYRYLETSPGAPLSLGEQAPDDWGVPCRPVFGPPIPNNHCEVHYRQPRWPWTHAAHRQLDLLGGGGPP